MVYFRRYGFALLVALAVLFPLAFYSSELVARRELSVIEKAVFVITKPAQIVFSFVNSQVRSVFSNYVDLRSARDEAQALRQEQSKVKVEMQILRELEAENIRLRKLLNFVQHLELRYLSGQVESADPTFFYRSLRLNRGEDQGVRPGMGVVAAEGVVGVVMRTAAGSCDVLLITDPNSNMDVINARNRRRGVLQGVAGQNMQFKFLDRGSRVQVGDEIVTSGLTGAFPRGISVGKVVSISPEPDGLSQTVEVEASVNFGELSEALILLTPSREVEVIRQIGGADWMDELLETAPRPNSGVGASNTP